MHKKCGAEGYIAYSVQTEDQIRISDLSADLLRQHHIEKASPKPKSSDSESRLELLFRWNLDKPKSTSLKSVCGLCSVELRGWVLSRDNSLVYLALRQRGWNTRCYPLNENRPDVIIKILEEEPERHSKLVCGFWYPIQFIDTLEVGFECNEEIRWFTSITCKELTGVQM